MRYCLYLSFAFYRTILPKLENLLIKLIDENKITVKNTGDGYYQINSNESRGSSVDPLVEYLFSELADLERFYNADQDGLSVLKLQYSNPAGACRRLEIYEERQKQALRDDAARFLDWWEDSER